VTHPRRSPDFSVPSTARMYDYFLGGKDNYRADREAADRVIEAYPETRRLALANRRFLTRAVWYLAEHGIRQFIDLGSGLPTSPNVHEVARQLRPDARVVYVDNDPVVASHGRAMCDTASGITFAEHDIRQPQDILSDSELTGLLDLSVPVALLAVSILHFMPDADKPGEILAAFRSAMAPGSYLALSHATTDGADDRVLSEIASVYKTSTAPAVPRASADIQEFFTGFDLVEPGLADVSQWRSDMSARPTKIRFLAGVGRKSRELSSGFPALPSA
jgi:S-adenosyl methyltransferase